MSHPQMQHFNITGEPHTGTVLGNEAPSQVVLTAIGKSPDAG